MCLCTSNEINAILANSTLLFMCQFNSLAAVFSIFDYYNLRLLCDSFCCSEDNVDPVPPRGHWLNYRCRLGS